MIRSEASAEPGGHPKQGAVTPRRRAVGKTRLSPSQGPYRRPTSLRPMPVRPHGRGLSQAANLRGACAGRLTLSLMWFAWASRPSLRALSYHFTTSYDATLSGTAYTDHGKSAVGRPDGAHRAGARLVILDDPQGKGVDNNNNCRKLIARISARTAIAQRS